MRSKEQRWEMVTCLIFLLLKIMRTCVSCSAQYFADGGYHPIPAVDGRDALDIMDKEYIDLIVADIMMPNMDGYELTKALREADYQLPILIVTAKAQFEDLQKAFRLGTDDYMIKPVNVNELLFKSRGAASACKNFEREKKIVVGGTVLDYDALTVTRNGEESILPQKEFFCSINCFLIRTSFLRVNS